MSNNFQCPFFDCARINIRDSNLVAVNGLLHSEVCESCERLIYICKECHKAYEHHVNFGMRGLCFTCVGMIATSSHLLDEQCIDSGHEAFTQTPKQLTIQICSPTASPSLSSSSSSMSDYNCPSPLLFLNNESIDELYDRDDQVDVGSDGDEEDEEVTSKFIRMSTTTTQSNIKSYLKPRIIVQKDQAIDLTRGLVIKMNKGQAIDLSSPSFSATSPSYSSTSPTYSSATTISTYISNMKYTPCPMCKKDVPNDEIHTRGGHCEECYYYGDIGECVTPTKPLSPYVVPAAPKRVPLVNAHRQFKNPEEAKEARRVCQEAGQAIHACQISTSPAKGTCPKCEHQFDLGDPTRDDFHPAVQRICTGCQTLLFLRQGRGYQNRVEYETEETLNSRLDRVIQSPTVVKKTVKRKRRSELDDLREGAMNIL